MSKLFWQCVDIETKGISYRAYRLCHYNGDHYNDGVTVPIRDDKDNQVVIAAMALPPFCKITPVVEREDHAE